MADDDIILLVCLPAAESHFADDVAATCLACGAAVVHRPHAPAAAVPICLDCYTLRAAAEDSVFVTEASLRELLLWGAPTKGIQ